MKFVRINYAFTTVHTAVKRILSIFYFKHTYLFNYYVLLMCDSKIRIRILIAKKNK